MVDQTQDYRGLGYTDQRKIARDSQGNLYLAYRKKYRINGLLRYHIFVARSSDSGGTWAVLNDAPIERVGDYVQRVPAIAIDAADRLHVVWYGNDADNTGDNQRQIKYARSTDAGASWSRWINVAAIAGYDGQRLWQEHPCIAVHGRAVYLAWQGLDATYQAASQVKFAASLDGGSWGAWQNVSPTDTGNRSRPTLVATHDGARLYILAYGDVNRRQQIVWTSSTDGGNTWASWACVSPAESDQRHVSVANDRHGALHAVWRQADATGLSRICYAHYDGRAWSARAPVGADQQLNQFFPSLTVTSDDTLWVAWTATANPSGYPADDPVAGRVSYAQLPRGGRWSGTAQLANGGDRSIYASLRRNDPDDDAIDLIWLNNDGANLPIYHTRLAARHADGTFREGR
jgi:hypothetical protein